jgi:response regulator RpfG family c-di-GMP phosphodiesterase
VEEISELDIKLLEVFCSGVAIAFDNILLTQEITDTQAELILRLGDVVESRSNEAGNHVRRMAEVCHLLASASGGEEETAVLQHAAPMHDIGKIATPDAVLLKPGKLNAAEWEIMKQHPTVGLSILNGSQRPILKAAAVIAHQHHEKYDGSGYPQGLKGDAIHLYARIVAVADVFDALMHKRCYKEAWPLEQVVEHLRSVAGQHLDPYYVDLLVQNIDKALAINQRFPDWRRAAAPARSGGHLALDFGEAQQCSPSPGELSTLTLPPSAPVTRLYRMCAPSPLPPVPRLVV